MFQRQPQSFDYCRQSFHYTITCNIPISFVSIGKAALHTVSKDKSLPALGQESDDVTKSDLIMTAAEYLPASVQEDSDVTDSDVPVMAGEFSFLFLLYTLFLLVSSSLFRIES